MSVAVMCCGGLVVPHWRVSSSGRMLQGILIVPAEWWMEVVFYLALIPTDVLPCFNNGGRGSMQCLCACATLYTHKLLCSSGCAKLPATFVQCAHS